MCGNCSQGLLGPGSEPVDGDIVHQAREVPATILESVSCRGHAQHYVHVVGALLDEVGPAALLGGGKPSLGHLIPHLHVKVGRF